jgi:hypothetical protein
VNSTSSSQTWGSRRVDEYELRSELVGTILGTQNVGRFAMSPQPSLDPNDPLVSILRWIPLAAADIFLRIGQPGRSTRPI